MTRLYMALGWSVLLVIGSGCALVPGRSSVQIPVQASVIVIPDVPTVSERHAAVEFQRHLATASGHTVPVLSSSETSLSADQAARYHLAVGGRLQGEEEILSPGEARLRVSEGGVRLYGADWDNSGAGRSDAAPAGLVDGSGILAAVHGVLQAGCGFRWIMPGADGVLHDRVETLRLPPGERTLRRGPWRACIPEVAACSPQDVADLADGLVAAAERQAYRAAGRTWLQRQALVRLPPSSVAAAMPAWSPSPLPYVGLPLGTERLAQRRLRRYVRSESAPVPLVLPLDSWWSCGLLNYVAVRVQQDPGLAYADLEADFCALFGAAGPGVRAWYRTWQEHVETEVMPRLDEIESAGFGNRRLGLLLLAGELFPARVFAEARAHLYGAPEAAESHRAKRLVQQLFLAAEHQALLAEAVTALQSLPRSVDEMEAALQRCRQLQRFRRQQSSWLGPDLDVQVVTERCLGDVSGLDLLTLFAAAEPIEPLPLLWYHCPDPDDVGIRRQWQRFTAADLRASGWAPLALDRPWNRQSKAAAAEGEEETVGAGVGWIGLVREIPPRDAADPLYLVAHGVTDSCRVYLNGTELYAHNPVGSEALRSFRVDLSPALFPEGGEQTIMIRLEHGCSAGPGGIWRPLWLAEPRADAPAPPAANAEAD